MGAALEDEAPRLAEINRSIQDFRNEFREAVKSMVRRDVYDANMETMKLQINNLQAALANAERDRDNDDKERRSTRALAVGIAIPGAISFLIAIINWLTR
jgi:predicted  nucleic acid-binding Zn-ribbon protein